VEHEHAHARFRRSYVSQPVIERIERARGELAEGKLGAAVGSLGDLVYATRDPRLLREMHALGEEGLARAGRFSKGEWKRLLKGLDKQLTRVTPDSHPVAVTK
jgi:hypothetical protein